MVDKSKNYGCLHLIGAAFGLYLVLFLINTVTNYAIDILSNPLINYGIPVVLLLLLLIKSEREKK